MPPKRDPWPLSNPRRTSGAAKSPLALKRPTYGLDRDARWSNASPPAASACPRQREPSARRCSEKSNAILVKFSRRACAASANSRSSRHTIHRLEPTAVKMGCIEFPGLFEIRVGPHRRFPFRSSERSEEHTSELQSQSNLVCRLLLEKKKKSETRIAC